MNVVLLQLLTLFVHTVCSLSWISSFVISTCNSLAPRLMWFVFVFSHFDENNIIFSNTDINQFPMELTYLWIFVEHTDRNECVYKNTKWIMSIFNCGCKRQCNMFRANQNRTHKHYGIGMQYNAYEWHAIKLKSLSFFPVSI